jgi:hypothetical protein
VFIFGEHDTNYGGPVDLQVFGPEINDARTLKKIWQHIKANEPRPKEWLKEFAITLTAGLSNYDAVEDSEKSLQQHLAEFAAYWTVFSKVLLEEDPSEYLKRELNIQDGSSANLERFWADLRLVCEGRSFIVTESGRFGLAPWISKPGDWCVVLFGGRSPFVLRREMEKSKSNEVFRLAGECFLHGLMRGEAIDAMEKGKLKTRSFTII